MDRIIIDKPRPDDAYAIQEVYYKAWLATYPNKEAGITAEDIKESYKDAFTEKTLAARREQLENMPESKKMLVAKDGDRVVGVTRLVLGPEENKLQTMYILPEYQRKGIGTMLWREVSKLLVPGKKTTLDVATYNENAISFYEKLGFNDTGKRFTDERFRMPSGAIIPEMEMVLDENQKMA